MDCFSHALDRMEKLLSENTVLYLVFIMVRAMRLQRDREIFFSAAPRAIVHREALD